MKLYRCDPGKNKDCPGRLGRYCMNAEYCFLTSKWEYAEEAADGNPVLSLEFTPDGADRMEKEKLGKPGGE